MADKLSLPSISQHRQAFLTDISSYKTSRKHHHRLPSKDRAEVFSVFMDSAITKKFQSPSPIETERQVSLYDEEENIKLPKTLKENACLRGTKAVFKFYQNYKKLTRVVDERTITQEIESPYTAMLEKSQNIMAFPSTIGVIKSKGKGNSIEIPNYCLGDHKSELLSAALSHVSGVQELILSKNRLTDKGLDNIMKHISSDLWRLDLSSNKITRIHPGLIKILSGQGCRLTYLNLENNKLSDDSITSLCLVLSMNKTVKYLNLGRNRLTKGCVESLSLLLENNKTIEELYLHWNKINGSTAKLVFQRLETNCSLLVLDYSYNSISEGVPSVAPSIATMLSKNKSLLHVDLSFNNFTLSESKEIGEALKKNRSIYGFHFLGNCGYVDYKGFLKFDNENNNSATEHSHVKIQSFDVVHRRPKLKMTADSLKDVCWICEGWSTQEIHHHLDSPADKFAEIFLNFNGYRPTTIKVENGWIKYAEMFPPQETSFYLFNNKKEFVLPEFQVSVEKLDFSNNDLPKRVTKKVNVTSKRAQRLFEGGRMNTRVLPRTPDVTRKEAKKKWRFHDSIWAKEWKREDEDVTNKCFERDWSHSKIPNLVKNSEEQLKVKSLLHLHYKHIKDIYRFYSSWSPFDSIWAVSANAFTEFCNEAKIISKQLPLKIVDLTFITTNSISGADWKSSSMVPERGLVRFQFLEAVVRLSDEKFKKNGLAATMLESVTLMIDNHFSHLYSKYQSQTWRETVYFVEEVDFLLKKFRPVFSNIFKRNSKQKVKPGEKAFMCLDQFKSVCDRAGLLTGTTTQRNSFINFNISFMTQVDEVQSERILKMTEIQMIQALSRMADEVGVCVIATGLSESERQSRSFHLKLEEMIYTLIQSLCSDDIKNMFPIPSVSVFQESKEDEE